MLAEVVLRVMVLRFCFSLFQLLLLTTNWYLPFLSFSYVDTICAPIFRTEQLCVCRFSPYYTRTEENIKIKIRELNDGTAGHIIPYSYTDNFYEQRGNNKEI